MISTITVIVNVEIMVESGSNDDLIVANDTFAGWLSLCFQPLTFDYVPKTSRFLERNRNVRMPGGSPQN